MEVRFDHERGCGWRKPGGLYLIAAGPGRRCGLLPLELTRCPTCDHGIKPSRSWTWIDVQALIAGGFGCAAPAEYCSHCALPQLVGRHGLLWVGEAFYPTPGAWLAETNRLGISRRISAFPKGFKLGETWVMMAHRKCIPADVKVTGTVPPNEVETETIWTAGIFHAFLPSAVEYVVKGDESAEQLEELTKRGITPVRVERTGPPPEQREGPLEHDPAGPPDPADRSGEVAARL